MGEEEREPFESGNVGLAVESVRTTQRPVGCLAKGLLAVGPKFSVVTAAIMAHDVALSRPVNPGHQQAFF